MKESSFYFILLYLILLYSISLFPTLLYSLSFHIYSDSNSPFTYVSVIFIYQRHNYCSHTYMYPLSHLLISPCLLNIMTHPCLGGPHSFCRHLVHNVLARTPLSILLPAIQIRWQSSARESLNISTTKRVIENPDPRVKSRRRSIRVCYFSEPGEFSICQATKGDS